MKTKLITTIMITLFLASMAAVAMPVKASEVPPLYVDIKPGSWPNPINVKSRGVLPVAICGTKDFDVRKIDPVAVRISHDREVAEYGIPPLRWSYADVATPYTGPSSGGHALGGDGYLDLVLHFDTQDIVAQSLSTHIGETVPLYIWIAKTSIWGMDVGSILGRLL